MSIVRLAWAYLAFRPLLTALHLALLAMGVATVVFLLLFTQQAEERLARDGRGIDLVVGAKGSPLQLILSSVFHADIPTGNITLAGAEALAKNPMVALAVPLALGDSFRGYRIVGTDARFLELHGAKLAKGAAFGDEMQAVLGSEVARRTGLDVGSAFEGSHGLATEGTAHAGHPFKVVGILAPTGSVVDRLVITPLESVWHVHEAHAAPGAPREITALLVRYATPLAAALLPRQVNATTAMQAASPAYEGARLLALIGVGAEALRVFALILMASAALSVFIALTSALEERRYDLALLRVLGAGPGKLLALVAVEGMTLMVSGVILGFALGHGSAEILGHLLAQSHQWPITGRLWADAETALLAAALAAGFATCAIPALLAYRSDPGPVLQGR